MTSDSSLTEDPAPLQTRTVPSEFINRDLKAVAMGLDVADAEILELTTPEAGIVIAAFNLRSKAFHRLLASFCCRWTSEANAVERPGAFLPVAPAGQSNKPHVAG